MGCLPSPACSCMWWSRTCCSNAGIHPLPSAGYSSCSCCRSEERRVGKECRYWRDWSSDVFSSDLFTVTGLLVYVVVSHVLQQRRHPSAAIGWVFFMFLLPYAALPLYLLFGTRKLTRTGRSRADARAIPHSADGSAWPAEVAAALGQPCPAKYRALCVHADGSESLRALLQLIDGARQTLDVCSFMLGRERSEEHTSE